MRSVHLLFVTNPVMNLPTMEQIPRAKGKAEACSLSMPRKSALGTAYMIIIHSGGIDKPRLKIISTKSKDFHMDKSNDFKMLTT